jgi:NAD(P)-dependent dehydrogenase (short-subunit alcohol dehydrogenase family)
VALADFDLTGRRVLVTGAGRGIGKGIALVMAEAGADVGVTSLGQANADRVAAEVRVRGRRGFGWAADGTSVASMQAIAEDVIARLGGLDILVNCVGDSIPGAVAAAPGGTARVMTEAEWHRVVDINLTQAFVGCHVFGPHLLAQESGCAVNISGIAGIRATANQAAYAASKAGLTRMTEVLAQEWAPYHVRVNAIAPGQFTDPEQVTPEQFAERERVGASRVPLGRLGRMRDVGLLATFLASDAAAYITGQTIALDGGRTIAS